jgi:ubiquinol-cytochrome c reductase cytochrome b subunit
MTHEPQPKGPWIETRLPVRRLWQGFLRESIPGGARWAYVFGSLCLALLGVQLLTGVALVCFYVPSPDHALASLTYLAGDIPWGRVVLGLHHWSANLLVGVIGLHLLQTFLWGAYKRPRELVWWSGIGLLLLVQAFHFTGFALPWDQAAYWATEVGTSIVGTIPAVGPYLLKILRGGEEVGAITLTHFYALHIVVLPGIVAVLVILHLICLRLVGPGGRGTRGHPPPPPTFTRIKWRKTPWPSPWFWVGSCC